MRKRILSFMLIITMLCSNIVEISANSSVITMSMKKGEQYLIETQNEDGSWGQDIDIKGIYTSNVLNYLKDIKIDGYDKEKSQKYLDDLSILDNDRASNILSEITDKDKVVNYLYLSQNKDGGWGVDKGYKSNPTDTALVMQSLIKFGNYDEGIMKSGVEYLLKYLNEEVSLVQSDDWTIGLDLYEVSQCIKTLSLWSFESKEINIEIETNIYKYSEVFKNIMEIKDLRTMELDEFIVVLSVLDSLKHSVGIENLNDIKETLCYMQNDNGSWFNNASITTDVLRILKNGEESSDINIALYKYNEAENTKVESDIYDLDDTCFVEITGLTNDEYMNVYVSSSTDKIIPIMPSEDKHVFSINDIDSGLNKVNVIVKDKSSGVVKTTIIKDFTVTGSSVLTGLEISLDKYFMQTETTDDISVYVTQYIKGNMDVDTLVKLTISDEVGVVFEDTISLHMKAGVNEQKFKYCDFAPDTSVPHTYTLKVESANNPAVYNYETFKVISKNGEMFVDGVLTKSKEILSIGEDTINGTINLEVDHNSAEIIRDIVITIDRSGSMNLEDRITNTKIAAKAFVEKVLDSTEHTRIAVVNYAGAASIEQDFTQDKDLLFKAIDRDVVGGTNSYAGLEKAGDLLNKSNAQQKVIFIMTDGEPTSGVSGTPREIITEEGDIYNPNKYEVAIYDLAQDYIKQKDYEIFSMAFSVEEGSAGYKLMKYISSYNVNDERNFSVVTNENLQEVINSYDNIAEEMANMPYETEVTITAELPQDKMKYTSFSPKPKTIKENKDGTTTVVWKINSAKINSNNQFTVNFAGENLKDGEKIKLLSDVFLEYRDPDNNLVICELGDLYTQVADSRVSIATDNTIYSVGENLKYDVQIEKPTKDTDVNYRITVTDEEEKVVDILDYGDLTLSEDKRTEFNGDWTVADITDGNYKIAVEVLQNGNLYGKDEKLFEVVSNGNVSLIVSADKETYAPNEAVLIKNNVKNSFNTTIHDAVLETIIYDEKGTVMEQFNKKIYSISSSNSYSSIVIWNTAEHANGEYYIKSILKIKGVDICTAEGRFIIERNYIQDNDGNIEANILLSRHNIYPSETVSYKLNLHNKSKIDLSGLDIKVSLIEIESGKVVEVISEKLELFDFETELTLNNILANGAVPVGAYLVSVTTDYGQGDVILDYSYLIIEAPFTLNINNQNNKELLYLAFAGDTEGVSLLDSLVADGFKLKVVSNMNDFSVELENSEYVGYILLNASFNDVDLCAEMLKSKVENGKNLVVSGGAYGENVVMKQILGIESVSIKNIEYMVNIDAVGEIGNHSYFKTGTIQCILPKNGTKQIGTIKFKQ